MTRWQALVRVLAALSLAGCATSGAYRFALAPDDSPDPAERPAAYLDAPTYEEALRTWRTPHDVSAWAGARFTYDRSRARLLSESARARGAAPAIHRPPEFFAAPSGICLDLARFTVETLGSLDPALAPRYLMIEFEPVTIDGETLRLHWLASYRRDGELYFAGDSKRPGHIAGPYPSVPAFLAHYARYRQRTVVAWRETPTFERRRRTPAPRAPGLPATQDFSALH